MQFEVSLFEYLSTDADLSALVGTRVYHGRLPEKAVYPAVSWGQVSARRGYDHDPYPDSHAWVTKRVQFNCWHPAIETAAEVGEAVIAALTNYSGDMEGQLIGSSFVENELDSYDATFKIWRRIVDVMVSYQDEAAVSS
jgi:Protein of unknown function (DUF3168)